MSGSPEQPSFDAYAGDYEAALNHGLNLTGESRDFYARGRVEIVRDTCRRLGLRARAVCDYGCGTGDTLPLLRAVLGADRLIGLDPPRLRSRKPAAGISAARWNGPPRTRLTPPRR
jgi:hypothetical protein